MKSYFRITIWYLLFGGAWIFFTDRFLSPISPNVKMLTEWQTAKGWIFVLVSGTLIFFLTKRAADRGERAEKLRMDVFKRTVKTSHHILLNYFNQMQLVILEAERSSDFDKSLIVLAREITDKATIEVHRLDNEGALPPVGKKPPEA